jgi:ribosomal protein S18 acetylase RimI-like enzyme
MPTSGTVLPAVVRRASRADAPTLAELYRRQAELHEGLAGGCRLKDRFDWVDMVTDLVASPLRALFVAESGDTLLGLIHVSLRSGSAEARASLLRRLSRRLRGRRSLQPADAIVVEPFGVVEDCFVVPEARRQGTGRELTRCGLAWLEERGVGRVELMVLATNPAAVAFWENLGFAVLRHWMTRRLSGPV